jgi:hypothetical protein
MASDPRRPAPQRPAPPRGGRPPAPKPAKRKIPGLTREKPDTAEHAREVRAVARGKDIVEPLTRSRDASKAPFPDLLVVRSWMKKRPIEATQPAAALVRFPRMWTTKRGRYCRFQAPGAGIYGLVRARPTF